MHDFEDALIAESAARNGMNVAITYNVTDRTRSPVTTMPPIEFANVFKPADIEYEEIPRPQTAPYLLR